MSDREALKIFARQPVTNEMIQFLAATTSSIIQVKSYQPKYSQLNQQNNLLVSQVSKKSISLVNFIKNLIKYSNVQTPTLMASLIYLNKLRNLLPANAIGMETTRHRIFLSALILSAKSLNDSSPLNKHWTKYTDGLLTIEEVNMAERELIGLLKWDINIKEDELLLTLQPFLSSIKKSLIKKQHDESIQKINYYRLSNSYSQRSLPLPSPTTPTSVSSSISSHSSLTSSNSNHSLLSLNRSNTSSSLIEDSEYPIDDIKKRLPLSSKNINTLNRPTNAPRQLKNLPYNRQLSSYSDKLTHFYNQNEDNLLLKDSKINLSRAGKIVS